MFIFMRFLVEKGAINQVRMELLGGGNVGSSKMRKLRTEGGGVTPYVYVRTYTATFHVFGIIFLL